jgi:4,4'-diaponeurosporenoate glycosyltransferase
VLVFLDADVVPGPHLLDALATTVAAHPDTLVTVQPWHRTERLHEQWSLLFNLSALMGSGAFSVLGHRRAGRVAFGPVLACSRARYDELGGHAHSEVRAAVLEDIALARRFGRVDISIGARGDTQFRMYPAGLRSLVQGWTKGMGIGLDATPWWAVLGVAGWMWSLAGGWLASPWFWAASAVQLWVLGRVAGRWSPLAVVLHPLLTAGFVLIVVRSVVLRRLGRTVAWKGRRVRPDQATG